MDSKSRHMYDARYDVLIAGSRAATLLRFLLENGRIPAAHVSHAREICDEHTTANNRWSQSTREVANG